VHFDGVGGGFEFTKPVANHITTNQFQNDYIIKWYKTERGGVKGEGGGIHTISIHIH